MEDDGSLTLRGAAGNSVEFFILDGSLNIWATAGVVRFPERCGNVVALFGGGAKHG